MRIEVERLTKLCEIEQRVRVKFYPDPTPDPPAVLCDISATLAVAMGKALIEVGECRCLKIETADEEG